MPYKLSPSWAAVTPSSVTIFLPFHSDKVKFCVKFQIAFSASKECIGLKNILSKILSAGLGQNKALK